MGLARYFVLQRGGAWLVTLEGGVIGRYTSRTEALEAAITMADLMGAMHHDADVMVEAANEAGLELVWSFGRDPSPKAPPPRRRQREVPPHHIHMVQKGEARSA